MTSPAPLQLVRTTDLHADIVAELDRELDARPEYLARGVYKATWLFNDRPLMFSVNSRHGWQHWISWRDGMTQEEIEAELWADLDLADPVAG